MRMYLPVRQRLLRLIKAAVAQPLTKLTIFLLDTICCNLVIEVENLKGTFELVQMLRILVLAHMFRFVQSILGENKVPPFYYLRNVLRFHDLPITAAISAFYSTFHILPTSSVLYVTFDENGMRPNMFCGHSDEYTEVVLSPWFLLLPNIIIPMVESLTKRGMVANNSIRPTSNFGQWESEDPINIQVKIHFATILLAMICVDLVIQIERLEGACQVYKMALVLVSMHIPCFTQFRNMAPSLYYLRNVLLFCDIPVTAAIAAFYVIFCTFSKTLVLVFFLELCLLALIHIFISKQDKAEMLLRNGVEMIGSMIKQIQESENDILPTQASSLTVKFIDQHNLDAANNSISSTSNFGQPEICDPPFGNRGFSSTYDASKRGGEDDAVTANSISDPTDLSKWVKEKRIGYGQYGNVYVVKHRKTGERRAVKELNVRENENDESIRQEVKILSKLKRHRNIVKYYGHNMDEQGHISIHMEYIQQGSLYDYTRKRGKLDEYLIRNFTVQILSGLFHLHHFKVVHRDIKSENLLVDSNETIKLVDFGLAKTLAKSVSKHSVGGTLCYAAPELLQNKPYHSSSEGSAADIWSLGCVIIEMFIGELPEWPFPDPPQPHPPIPEGLCEEGKDFLKLCFIRNIADRPSAEKLLEHPFVNAQTGADGRK